MFEDWVYSISYGGSGCINLKLNEYLCDSETVHLLKEMIGKTYQSLDKYEPIMYASIEFDIDRGKELINYLSSEAFSEIRL